MVTNSINRMSGAPAALSANQRLVLQSLVPIAMKAVTVQLEPFGTRLTEALLKLADQSVRPNESTDALVAYNHLRRNGAMFSRAISNRLSDLLLREVNAVGVKAQSASLDDDEDFSLVSMEEMEDKVLIGNLSQAIAHDHTALLNALNIRVGDVMKREEISLEQNPFRPALFVQAVYEAWCAFDPAVESHRVVLRLLRPGVFFPIEPILKDLNDALVARGVVPNLKTAYRGKKPGNDVQAQPAGEERGLRDRLQDLLSETPAPAPTSAQDTAQAGKIGRQALHDGQAPAHHGQPDADAIARFIAGNPLFGYLSQLQKHGNIEVEHRAVPQSADTLRQIKKQAPQGTLTVVDANTIELLAKVFDYVFGEQTVANEIKRLIAQLQIPLLKAALIDKEFFFREDHPARNLLESLAKSSLAWNQEKGHDDPLYKMMERIVERVQNDFDHQVDLFADLVTDLDSFIKQENKSSSKEWAASIAQAMHQERMALAQKKAEADIALRVETGEVPGFIEHFLENQWTQVLTLAYSVQETKPKAFANAVHAMDLLIWSVNPKPSPEERKKLLNRLPALLSLVNAWLNAVKWDGEARVKFISQLAERHAANVRVPIELTPRHEFETAVTVAQRASERRFTMREKEMRMKPDDQFVHLVGGMAVDDWVQFTRSNGEKVKFRLSWISPKRSRFVFSNRQGDAPLIFSAEELAQSLRGGHTTIMPLEPIIGRALHVALDEARV